MLPEKLAALFVGFFSVFSFLFSMQAIPPLFPTLVEQFGVGYAVASSLMWLVALPSLLLAVFGGFLTGKYGVRPLAVAGIVIVTAASALSSFSASIVLLQMCRLLLGIGGALVFVSAPTLIFQWFEKREMGLAMGIFGLTMPVATVIAFNTLGFLSSMYGWRVALFITTGVNVASLLVCVVLAKEAGSVSHEKASLSALRNVNIWVLAAIWAFFNMAAAGYSTWGKTIFIGYALSPAVADLLAGMLMLGILATPLTGFISDKCGGRRRFFILLASVAIFLMFPLFPYVETSSFLWLALALGLLSAFLPPAVFALPEEILGAGQGVVGWGLLSAFANLGLILGPFSVGLVLDSVKGATTTFFLLSLFGLSAILFAVLLKSR